MTEYTAKAIVEAMEAMTTKEKCEYISAVIADFNAEVTYWRGEYNDLEDQVMNTARGVGMVLPDEVDCNCHTDY